MFWHAVSDFAVPPTIDVSPARTSLVDVGKNLTLTCKGYGDPSPTFTWTKDGHRRFKVRGFELHLANVQRVDAGSYRCTASNGYGEDASRISIVGLSCKLS